CRLQDVGVHEGTPYLTMTFVEGKPLSEVVTSPLSPRRVIDIVHKLALGMDFAHREGVTHRALTPGHVLLTPAGEPVILNFGLARRTDKANSVLKLDPGAVMGTLAYMAPEQVEGDVKSLGPSCDIYSLGVILFELLTGRPPFQGSCGELVVQILRQEPEPPSRHRPGLPAQLD